LGPPANVVSLAHPVGLAAPKPRQPDIPAISVLAGKAVLPPQWISGCATGWPPGTACWLPAPFSPPLQASGPNRWSAHNEPTKLPETQPDGGSFRRPRPSG